MRKIETKAPIGCLETKMRQLYGYFAVEDAAVFENAAKAKFAEFQLISKELFVFKEKEKHLQGVTE